MKAGNYLCMLPIFHTALSLYEVPTFNMGKAICKQLYVFSRVVILVIHVGYSRA